MFTGRLKARAGDILGSASFDWFALTCSVLYFIFFVAFLGCILQDSKCTADGMYGVKLMKIITLIPPIIFFGKLAFTAMTSESKFNTSRFQLGMLLAYFFLVFIFLCSDLAGNTEAAQNTNTLCLFILPIFIIASFYNTYETWKNGGPKMYTYLYLTLSVLYYCLFYFSMQYGGSTFGQFGNTSVNGVLMAVGILLIFQFAYVASKSWQESDLKKWRWLGLLDKPINGYVSSVDYITSKLPKWK
jgi:hypothetical protein